MKKLDAIIIGGFLLLCAVLFLLFHRSGSASAGRLKAEIYVAGQLARTVDLPDGETSEISIEDGKMIIAAGQDGVSVVFADCPNKICQHTGKITLSGQMITCLPNRIIIKLIDSGNVKSEVDAIAG